MPPPGAATREPAARAAIDGVSVRISAAAGCVPIVSMKKWCTEPPASRW